MIDLKKQLPRYITLTRMDRPTGILLLLWPTLWSLWLAAEGWPDWKNLLIFILGCILMRSAGCVINDYADRNIDRHDKSTQHHPLASGKVSEKEALILFTALCALAFLLVLFTNWLTVMLSFVGAALAVCHPLMNRHTYLPQLFLGAAVSWSVIMAFAAQTETLPAPIWLLYTVVVVWTVVYDTFYAMVARDDDIKIGVKSTAILFADADRVITASMQAFVLFTLVLVGQRFELEGFYYLGLIGAGGFFTYQQYLIRERKREACFKAFVNNNWVGACIFSGIFLHYQFGV